MFSRLRIDISSTVCSQLCTPIDRGWRTYRVFILFLLFLYRVTWIGAVENDESVCVFGEWTDAW